MPSSEPVKARSNKNELREAIESLAQPSSTKIPVAGEVEFAFSPNHGGEALVLKVIASARNAHFVPLLLIANSTAPTSLLSPYGQLGF